MIDIAKFKGLQPTHAEGRVRIDLTDPVTGKVQQRQEGKNHVFTDAMLCGTDGDWVSDISRAMLGITTNTEPVDTAFPYMLGTIVGYGTPSQGSSGLYRGAYSVANQVLAAINGLTSLRWKFQYDFTTAQANGTIGQIGLTWQYLPSARMQAPRRLPGFVLTGTEDYTCDGRYCYTCATTGIITKFDMYLGTTTTTIDISAVVGTVSGTTKYVGYAPATGKYYIYAASTTAANRKMYVFSDNTFSNNEATYSISNISMAGGPLYIYGNFAFSCGASNAIYGADFVNNTAHATYTVSANPFGTPAQINKFTIGYQKYIVIPGRSTYGVIFDMAAKAFSGILASAQNGASPPGNYGQAAAPLISTFMAGINIINEKRLYVNPAIAMKKLDVPVTKTSANGMTVTYELEVFW